MHFPGASAGKISVATKALHDQTGTADGLILRRRHLLFFSTEISFFKKKETQGAECVSRGQVFFISIEVDRLRFY